MEKEIQTIEKERLPSQGEEIRAARKRKGLTQKQLAEKMGVTETYISQYERDLRRPKPETVRRIAAALEIDVFSIADFENATELLFSDTNEGIAKYGDQFPALLSAFCALTDEGKREAVKRVQELIEVPGYKQEADNA